MKKYIFIAFVAIGVFTTSCTTDNYSIPETRKKLEIQEFENTLMQNRADSISAGDTGGQGGSTPIKP